jgi:Domain of unknown function (DUF1998)
MSQPGPHRRRVGAVRPSHLMFTAGVGAVMDLPNFAVLIRGLDEWRYDHEYERLTEPRLLAAVQAMLGPGVAELRPAPWLAGTDDDPNGPAARIGVPVIPFPQWLRCTACDELGPYHPSVWTFANDKPRRPDQAHFFHSRCPSRRPRPLAVPARFLLACVAGHLDDFPYRRFVHGGDFCPDAENPRLLMRDFGGNLGANVQIECTSCGQRRNINQALGTRGRDQLPRCRGRHPHLQTFAQSGCDAQPHVLVLGASNQWFPQTLSALAVPKPSAGRLDDEVERHWPTLSTVHDPAFLTTLRTIPSFGSLARWSDEEIWDAIQRRRLFGETPAHAGYPDLRTPEWRTLSADEEPEPSLDFTIRRDPAGVPPDLAPLFCDIIQVERLREVRALVGFTRLDAPDPDDPDLVTRAPLTRGAPTWVPASEVRGEGIFLRIDEPVIAAWETQVRDSDAMRAHFAAYQRFRTNRYSQRRPGDFDPRAGWPGPRYLALHTLAHLLIRTIALECGYNSASLSERVYAADGEEPRAGILIYTAVPDAEGTLGGLVSLAEPDRLGALVRRALSDARRCSSDPLCAERLPQAPADFLHGAACHACLFVSETTCERGNRFLDRRLVVPVDDPKLALIPGA